jgi:hypothetical protein
VGVHTARTEEIGMSTIRMVDPARVAGKTREIFDAVLRREEKVFGATSVSNIWRCQGHVADYLEANWERARALMQCGRFAPAFPSIAQRRAVRLRRGPSGALIFDSRR